MSSDSHNTNERRTRTNREQWYQIRYAEAHALLKRPDDPYLAEEAFKELLQEAYMPLWMRVQYNIILADLVDEIPDAKAFLSDAKEVLQMFAEEQVRRHGSLDASAHKEDIESMKERFVKIAERIEARKDGWDDEPKASVEIGSSKTRGAAKGGGL